VAKQIVAGRFHRLAVLIVQMPHGNHIAVSQVSCARWTPICNRAASTQKKQEPRKHCE
jgi:hypothetical protein